MCYICANCKISQLPKTPAIPVVLKTRAVNYVNVKIDEETGEKKEILSKGVEIMQEVRMCPACAAEFTTKIVKKPVNIVSMAEGRRIKFLHQLGEFV